MAEAAQTAGAFEEGRVLPETQLAAEFYDRTPAALFGIPSTEFGQILYAIARKYLPEGSTQVETRQFCSALRLDDLVLARGCAAGSEKAWEVFLTRFREKLYEMALRIAREPSAAQDLSDSLYGDLYGLTSSDSIRASKLISYTGRGSLEGWLRTVLAQEFINRYRKNKRLVSLDETDSDEDGSHRHVPELVAPENNPPSLLTRALSKRQMKRSRHSPRMNVLSWPPIISTAGRSHRLPTYCTCTNPPSAAKSRKLQSLYGSKS